MGWTVLYIAFGIVALWLLGEVLLQYKARLRWRLLAFGGFMGVVAGALVPSVIIIGLGIAAFATGQTFVTLSYRRGFSTGWALGGRPGSSRRRRAGGQGARDVDPSLEISDLETYAPPPPAGSPDTADDYGYAPGYSPDQPGYSDQPGYTSDQPGYGSDQPGYSDQPAYGPGQYAQEPLAHASEQYPADQGYAAQDGYQYAGADGYGSEQHGYGTAPAHPGVPAADETQAYAYGDQQHYAAYSDPYIGYDGAGGYGQQPQQMPPAQQYDYGYDQQQYQQPYYPDTPPGGVWVPQQRDANSPLPQEQPSEPPVYQTYSYPDDDPQPYGYYNGNHGY